MSTGGASAELESIEVDLLLEGVARQWGFDLRSHARPLLLRRLRRHLREERLDTFSALQARVLHDGEALEGLLRTLSCTPTSLFSDPAFFRDFRARVVPVLRTWPSVRVWHAGCGTGEDTYALAILLLEEGLWGRCRLYASDSSEGLLADARTGVLPLPGEEDARRYVEAGGKGALTDYYTRDGNWALLQPKLRDSIFFTQHNLATDGSFNEFHVIVCRDTLLTFNRTLHNRVHGRLFESLARFGFLCLGRKESVARTPHASAYEELEGSGRIFRRVT
ncbi:chemotaxis protein CheR [Pyxidicoccus fallax]|uniref:Chemotaxis protein CheR n=1 Tax=Pyxidicoccus fallax TaxID=394095 RepID=A0A848LVW8_9BACT|nr:CheR family methyltransferase [Pyxidicoccus fallax]NMO21781.1 chemotaxis protein CheR [Pyxidicoccus fallax]NPC84550.1 chemotaxis protein CheR [Pyxidicoccus fallax]